MQVTTCEARNRPFFIAKPCAGGCGHLFAKRDRIVVVEIETSIFRGDDVVKAYCPLCWEREQKHDDPPCEENGWKGASYKPGHSSDFPF